MFTAKKVIESTEESKKAAGKPIDSTQESSILEKYLSNTKLSKQVEALSKQRQSYNQSQKTLNSSHTELLKTIQAIRTELTLKKDPKELNTTVSPLNQTAISLLSKIEIATKDMKEKGAAMIKDNKQIQEEFERLISTEPKEKWAEAQQDITACIAAENTKIEKETTTASELFKVSKKDFVLTVQLFQLTIAQLSKKGLFQTVSNGSTTTTDNKKQPIQPVKS